MNPRREQEPRFGIQWLEELLTVLRFQ